MPRALEDRRADPDLTRTSVDERVNLNRSEQPIGAGTARSDDPELCENRRFTSKKLVALNIEQSTLHATAVPCDDRQAR